MDNSIVLINFLLAGWLENLTAKVFLFVTFLEIKLFFFSFKIYEIGPGEYFLYNFKNYH